MNHPNLAYRKGSDTCKLMSSVMRPETSTIQPWRTRTMSRFSAPKVSKGPISSAWVHTTPGPLPRYAPQHIVSHKGEKAKPFKCSQSTRVSRDCHDPTTSTQSSPGVAAVTQWAQSQEAKEVRIGKCRQRQNVKEDRRLYRNTQTR